MKITGNTVFITGGTAGLGLAMAQAFAKMENQVIVCGTNQHSLETVREREPQLDAVRCDITSETDLHATLDYLGVTYAALTSLSTMPGFNTTTTCSSRPRPRPGSSAKLPST